MNLPNKLTMLRVILVPVFMVFAALSRYGTQDFNAGLCCSRHRLCRGQLYRLSGRLSGAQK